MMGFSPSVTRSLLVATWFNDELSTAKVNSVERKDDSGSLTKSMEMKR